MTVLYSIYTDRGLVWAADRMITKVGASGRTTAAGTAFPKIFRVPGVGIHNQGALVGFYGQAYVQQQPMGQWLPAKIGGFAGSTALAPFAEYLAAAYFGEAAANQRKQVVGFHLGGFERRQHARVPVFYFVRNGQIDELSGLYKLIHANGAFEIDEQFLSDIPYVPVSEVRRRLHDGIAASKTPVWFRNGDVRAFAHFHDVLEPGIRGLLLQVPGYSVPTNISRWGVLARSLVGMAGGISQAYYSRGAPTMGGGTDVLVLPWENVPAG